MQTMSAIKNKQRRCTQLTIWMGFHTGNVSNQNQSEEVHTTHTLDGISCRQCQQSKSVREGAHNSHPGWDFMQAIKIKQRRCTPTHSLNGISCRQCQQSKSSRGRTHDSQTGWDFMQTMSAIKINQRRCTQLTAWTGFHAGNVSNQNQAEEVHTAHKLNRFHADNISNQNQLEKEHTTHSLDGISCRQSKSSKEGAHQLTF